MILSAKHDSRTPPSPPRCRRRRSRHPYPRRPRAQPHAVGSLAPAARPRDEARAAAVSPARQTDGAHARGRAPAGGGAARVASALGRRRRAAAPGRRPGGDPAREHRMLHVLSLAAGGAAAVYAPLSPGGRTDRGGGDPPPRAGAVRRPHRPRDRVERRSRRPALLRPAVHRSEEHTSELQSPCNLVCRLLLEKKKKK